MWTLLLNKQLDYAVDKPSPHNAVLVDGSVCRCMIALAFRRHGEVLALPCPSRPLGVMSTDGILGRRGAVPSTASET